MEGKARPRGASSGDRGPSLGLQDTHTSGSNTMKATDIMRTLQTDVDRLGAELLMCTDNCAGICCDQQAGVLPRGLHLDLRDVTRRGCLAVGQNPGPSNVSHRNHFRAPRISYDSVKAFYANAERFSYYKKALIIIDQLGFAARSFGQISRNVKARKLRRDYSRSPSKQGVIALSASCVTSLRQRLKIGPFSRLGKTHS